MCFSRQLMKLRRGNLPQCSDMLMLKRDDMSSARSVPTPGRPKGGKSFKAITKWASRDEYIQLLVYFVACCNRNDSENVSRVAL